MGKRDLIGFIEEYKIKNFKGLQLEVSPMCDCEIIDDLELNYGNKYLINRIIDYEGRKIIFSNKSNNEIIYGIESGYFIPANPKIKEKYYQYLKRN